ncbi:MAG: hypothetical protein LBQ98_09195 [Nitrososphaerota archaeon]|nr:hypothetical protein [Nitrososphaerota archaeon]
MICCVRCGAFNPEESLNCSNCGAPLVTQSVEGRPYNRYEPSRHYIRTTHRRRGGLGLVLMGLLLVVIGASALVGFTRFWTYFWPIVLILLGVWVIILGLSRSRTYKLSKGR